VSAPEGVEDQCGKELSNVSLRLRALARTSPYLPKNLAPLIVRTLQNLLIN
jgi:hypothetical protein